MGGRSGIASRPAPEDDYMASADLLVQEGLEFKKRQLVKKHMVLKERQFVHMSEPNFMSSNQFCASARKIAPGRYSLEGTEATWYIILYYEPSKRSKVEAAFNTLGVDIADYEQVVVDLGSSD